MRPQAGAAAVELAEKLTEASLEEVADERRGEQVHVKREPPVVGRGRTQPEVTGDSTPPRPSAPTSKAEAPKEEGPQDLRVFELNSDSGKSTPSNNGKKGIKTSGGSEPRAKAAGVQRGRRRARGGEVRL